MDDHVPLWIQKAPKVLLHDHLDGGMRPETIIELATEYGYAKLPMMDSEDLAVWIRRGADRNQLELYLETFAHTTGVTQHADALERTAHEAAVDLAQDGLVYAELRFAPELHMQAGLSLDEVVEAVLRGVRSGTAGTSLSIGIICSAMRQFARSAEIAELAVRHRDDGVVGFDIAGPEAGFPPSRHLDAFQYCMRENFHITTHAGEAFGLASIHEALSHCGAERLGHGVRIVDDIQKNGDGQYELGRLASYVRNRRVPLELCPTSNVNTGAVPSIAEHPIGILKDLRFRVTVNTDNRLMSNVTLSQEFAKLVTTFGYDIDDVEWLTINAMKSAFWPFERRLQIINEHIKPGFSALRTAAL